MKYRLNPELIKICSPAVLVIDGVETEYPSGAALADLVFEKRYLVDRLIARDNIIVITLRENDSMLNTRWAGDEPITFF